MSFANIIIFCDIVAALAAVTITWNYVRHANKQRNVGAS